MFAHLGQIAEMGTSLLYAVWACKIGNSKLLYALWECNMGASCIEHCIIKWKPHIMQYHSINSKLTSFMQYAREMECKNGNQLHAVRECKIRT